MACKKSGLDKEYELSEEMSVFMGCDYASRKEITKELWKHIKKYDLQDENNRRLIIADERLEDLFGKDSFTMFEMASLISDHLF